MPPVIPKGTYHHNQKTNTITLNGGGEIILVGLDADRDKEGSRIGSLNASGAGVDQCEELNAKFWNLITGRLRIDVGIPRQLYGVCNPGAPSHHLAQRFGIARGSKKAYGCEVIMTESADNPHLPPDYLAKIGRYTGILKKRYVLGLWVANEGAIYPMFDREKHCQEVGNAAFKRIFFAVDDGFTVPFCLLVMGQRADGRIHVIDEVYGAEMAEAAKVLAARKMEDQYGRPDFIVCDPAAASIKGAFRTAGFTVVNGKNDVQEGITEVQNRLYFTNSTQPYLTIDPRCPHTISDVESYTWKNPGEKDEPVKADDHAADAVRYGAMAVKKPVDMVFEAADLFDTKTRAMTIPHEFEGDIVHGLDAGMAQDLSLAKSESRLVMLARAQWPTMRIWDALVDGKPRQDRRYIVFGGMGDGGMALVADTVSRKIVAEWEDNTATVEEVARRLCMLSLFFGHVRPDGRLMRAMLGYSRRGKGGGLTAELRRLRHDSLWSPSGETEPGWLPTPQEFADAIQDMRTQIVAGKVLTYQEEFVNQARSYCWLQTGTVGPLHLMDQPEDKGTHMDWVILTAGLNLMLKSAACNPVNMGNLNPHSMEARIRAKHGKKAKV